jgi:cell division protein FtsX
MVNGVDGVRVSATDVRTDDWPTQATDAIVKVVGTAHDRITGPIQTVARAIVYGLLAAILGVAALVLLVILLLRLVNNYLPDSVFGENHMWAAHLLVGVLFTSLGLVLMRLAKRPAE